MSLYLFAFVVHNIYGAHPVFFFAAVCIDCDFRMKYVFFGSAETVKIYFVLFKL